MAMRRVSKIAAHVIAPQVTSAGDGEPLVDPKEGTRYQCGVCKHIYRPEKDGGGKAFEDLPDTWKCPTCGAPKSKFKPMASANGGIEWVHEELVYTLKE